MGKVLGNASKKNDTRRVASGTAGAIASVALQIWISTLEMTPRILTLILSIAVMLLSAATFVLLSSIKIHGWKNWLGTVVVGAIAVGISWSTISKRWKGHPDGPVSISASISPTTPLLASNLPAPQGAPAPQFVLSPNNGSIATVNQSGGTNMVVQAGPTPELVSQKVESFNVKEADGSYESKVSFQATNLTARTPLHYNCRFLIAPPRIKPISQIMGELDGIPAQVGEMEASFMTSAPIEESDLQVSLIAPKN
jgi:hypothetical protein